MPRIVRSDGEVVAVQTSIIHVKYSLMGHDPLPSERLRFAGFRKRTEGYQRQRNEDMLRQLRNARKQTESPSSFYIGDYDYEAHPDGSR